MEKEKQQTGEAQPHGHCAKIEESINNALKGKRVRIESEGKTFEYTVRCAVFYPTGNDCQYIAIGWDVSENPEWINPTWLRPKEVADLLLFGKCTMECGDRLTLLDEVAIDKETADSLFFMPQEARKLLLDEQEAQRKRVASRREHPSPTPDDIQSHLLTERDKPEETPSSLLGKMVRVDFYDHVSLLGWHAITDINGEPDLCTTIGRVVVENKLAIVVASTVVADDGKNGERACDPFCIIKGAIEQIQELDIKAI